MTIRNSSGKFTYKYHLNEFENEKGKFLDFLICQGWFLGSPILFVPSDESNLDAIKDIDDTAERHLSKCGVVYVPSIEESGITIDNYERL